jgi:hypothetical protein
VKFSKTHSCLLALSLLSDSADRLFSFIFLDASTVNKESMGNSDMNDATESDKEEN